MTRRAKKPAQAFTAETKTAPRSAEYRETLLFLFLRTGDNSFNSILEYRNIEVTSIAAPMTSFSVYRFPFFLRGLCASAVKTNPCEPVRIPQGSFCLTFSNLFPAYLIGPFRDKLYKWSRGPD